ncbi:hypothetical protein EMIHUDRAFT_233408 [Emiliania huxleyi CCMP1516]|uniref:Uncharacterized protein n=2 Tax=Emiliania huxleyi TaxID=2903 RepID=A0A0D3K262_EMIH1|nr:hypothetical protein EMIHUDRAFT_233408 [Emiliania huxleyi CCMP1516]EOD29847.1 hypothetical protein EMIHUDRAFT_233408 [Emiliania huxleyi CCMP1516]|eukprot:XP_005782276.1 hypothetical protein EMIHUDRAFT_233408 [Emiliania huxleyi CCMP1516]
MLKSATIRSSKTEIIDRIMNARIAAPTPASFLGSSAQSARSSKTASSTSAATATTDELQREAHALREERAAAVSARQLLEEHLASQRLSSAAALEALQRQRCEERELRAAYEALLSSYRQSESLRAVAEARRHEAERRCEAALSAAEGERHARLAAEQRIADRRPAASVCGSPSPPASPLRPMRELCGVTMESAPWPPPPRSRSHEC